MLWLYLNINSIDSGENRYRKPTPPSGNQIGRKVFSISLRILCLSERSFLILGYILTNIFTIIDLSLIHI